MSHSLDPVVLQSFLGEVLGYLPALEHEVTRLRDGETQPDTFDEIHRLAHSIRSASEMIGLAQLASAARGVEELVSPVVLSDTPFDAAGLDGLERGVAAMRAGLQQPAPQPAASQDLDPPAHLLAAALVGGSGGDSQDEMPEIPEVETIAEDLVDTFQGEAEQLLDKLGHSLRHLREQPDDPSPALLEIRHSAHTLKGAAAMVGLDTTATVAHRMEDILDLLCSEELPLEPEIVDLLFNSYDCVADLVAARGHNRELRPRVLDLLAAHQAIFAILEAEEPFAPVPQREAGEEEIAANEEVDALLLDTFLEEAESHLASAGAALRTLSAQPADPGPALLEFRRAVHTIKGAAGMLGLSATSLLARRLQFLLDRVEEGAAQYSRQIFDTLSAGFDLLSDLVAAQGRNSAHLERIRSAFRNLDELLACRDDEGPAAEPGTPAVVPSQESVSQGGRDEPQQTVRVPIERLAGVGRIVGEIFLNASSYEQQIGAFRRDLDELTLNLARMRRISASLADVQSAEAQSAQDNSPAPHRETPSSASEFDVLEFDRYSRLHLLSRDLAEATNDLSTLSAQLQSMRAQFDSWTGRQRGLSSEAQDKLMRLRMVPLSTLANRLDRTVRVTANKTGKLASLTLEGMNTEFEKTVTEQLSAPLEHLLRNAVDHGIEPPAYRSALGKPATGRIRLTASHHGAHLVIRLSDDGSGLDYDKIRKRAVQLGWMSQQEAASMDSDALARLILEPGFSTARTINEVSGRGVGLDIVHAAVEALKGRLTIHSKPGAGTTFSLLLPVSLAVARAMIVEAAGSRFALSMASFTRALRVIHSEIEMRDERPGIQVEDKWIPVLWLADWLGLGSPRTHDQRLTLLFVDNGEQEIALAVDRVVEAREVVVKPLTGILRRLNRFAGATILGDGSVVLIVNSSALDPDPARATPAAIPVRAGASAPEVDILIVDDSLSIRRSVGNLIRGAGWRALQSRDGIEALEMLQHATRLPDLILMDVEMPRMDGYELASRLREQRAYDGVPIVMLTSRAGEKHRLKAASLGVDGYLVKPCPDDLLLSEVRRWLVQNPRSSQAAS